MLTVKSDFAPVQALRMLEAWTRWGIPMDGQIKWLHDINEVFHGRES